MESSPPPQMWHGGRGAWSRVALSGMTFQSIRLSVGRAFSVSLNWIFVKWGFTVASAAKLVWNDARRAGVQLSPRAGWVNLRTRSGSWKSSW